MRIAELLHGIVLERWAGEACPLRERWADPDDPRGVSLGVPFSASTGSKPMKTDSAPLGKAPVPSVVVQPVTPAVGAPHPPSPVTAVDSSAPGGAANTMDIPLQPARDGLPVAKGETATA